VKLHENFDFNDLNITIRHSSDPFLTAVQLTNDGSVYAPKAPKEDSLQFWKYLTLSGCLAITAALTIWLLYQRRKTRKSSSLKRKEAEEAVMVVEFQQVSTRSDD